MAENAAVAASSIHNTHTSDVAVALDDVVVAFRLSDVASTRLSNAQRFMWRRANSSRSLDPWVRQVDVAQRYCRAACAGRRRRQYFRPFAFDINLCRPAICFKPMHSFHGRPRSRTSQ